MSILALAAPRTGVGLHLWCSYVGGIWTGVAACCLAVIALCLAAARGLRRELAGLGGAVVLAALPASCGTCAVDYTTLGEREGSTFTGAGQRWVLGAQRRGLAPRTSYTLYRCEHILAACELAWSCTIESEPFVGTTETYVRIRRYGACPSYRFDRD